MADTMEDGLATKESLSIFKTNEKEDCETSEAESMTIVLSEPNEDIEIRKNNTNQDQNVNEFKTPTTAFAVPVPLPLLSLSASSQSKKSDNEKVKDSSVIKTQDKDQFLPNDLSYKSQPQVIYDEPEWSGETQGNYWFDVLKNGTIINNIPLKNKSYFIFGRLPSCDVTLEHPSLSRHHAVIQYSNDTSPIAKHNKGWYIYDLDSTHGTWVNKRKVKPKMYHKIKVGHIVKFGGSSRLHILQGPEDDEDQESEMTITEIKQQREIHKREAELLVLREKQEEEDRAEKERKMLEDRGCGWGIGEDAQDNGDENPFASLTSENESLYIDDPKKALKGFYEREGLDLPDYQFTDASSGSHKCTLEIPVDGPNGEELIAEAVVSGKKKDSVVACALEACRMLDKLGMLRSSTHESRKRKSRNWEDNDFYDSDEDTFLDRTGAIEKKRTQRMKKAGKEAAETYESLMTKYTKVTDEIQDIENQLQKAKADSEALANEEIDELDAYMISIKSGAMDSKTRLRLKGDLLRLKMEEQSLRRLVNIAKPAALPPLKPLAPVISGEKVSTSENLSRKLQHLQKQKHLQKKLLPVKPTFVDVRPDNYEEVEADDEGDNDEKATAPTVTNASQANKSAVCINKKEESNIPSIKRISHEKLPSNKSNSPIKKPQSESLLMESEEKPKSKKSSHHFSTFSALETIEKQKPSSKNYQAHQSHSDLDALDPKFATWVPPKEQSGDGRTSLNDKFGY